VHFTVTEDLDQALGALDLAFDLAAAGSSFNLPEALMWRACAYFHTGDLARATADADRLFEISNTLSAHTRQHAMGMRARILLGKGDWPGVIEQGEALRSLVRRYPDDSWCLIGASGVADGATAEILEGKPPSSDLEALVLRMVAESPSIRAATLLMPLAIASRKVADEDAHRAYARETPIYDREQIWDVTETNRAIADVVREHWEDLAPLLDRLDARARRGAKFAGALAAASREEMAAARGGPKPEHKALRELGYNGISQLLSYRPR
jgi:hypothetical protein